MYASQLKATIGHVFVNPPCTDDNGKRGLPVDGIFGSKSIYNRIVNSCFIAGITNTLLLEKSQQIANEYFASKG